MNLREHAVEWIESQPKTATFMVSDLYAHLKMEFPNHCDSEILTSDGKEPKWHKDARWALQDCKSRKTLKHVGSSKSSQWQRI